MRKKWSIFYFVLCIIVIIGGLKVIKYNNLEGENYLDIVSFIENNKYEKISLGNLIKIKGKESFLKGNLNNLDMCTDDEIHRLLLSKENNKYKSNGMYTSEEISTDEFSNLILSWNCETPEDTYVEILARAYIKERGSDYGAWSEYLSWGKWGVNIKRSSGDSSCLLAKINTDVFMVKDKINKVANKIQIKVNLYSENINETPSIMQLTATFMDSERTAYKDTDVINNTIEKVYYNNTIDTPCFSQYLREESIAPVICSPTSLTMILNRMGEILRVEDVAWSCYDYNYKGFGNWTFNVAFAGSLGYESYIEYGSFESLKREISKGYPIVVSVKYTNDIKNKKYPFIEGAPLTTSGHLIVVCGISTDIYGQTYIIVNDPAGKDNESVRRKYKIEEFLESWNTSNNAMYVVNKR